MGLYLMLADMVAVEPPKPIAKATRFVMSRQTRPEATRYTQKYMHQGHRRIGMVGDNCHTVTWKGVCG